MKGASDGYPAHNENTLVLMLGFWAPAAHLQACSRKHEIQAVGQQSSLMEYTD